MGQDWKFDNIYSEILTATPFGRIQKVFCDFKIIDGK